MYPSTPPGEGAAMVPDAPVASAPSPALARLEAGFDLVDALQAAERLLATVTAMKLRLIEAASQAMLPRGHDELADRGFRAELALALRAPERTVERWIRHAARLNHEFPATLDALEAGAITPQHARVIDEVLTCLPDDQRTDLEAQALEGAHRSTGEFRRWLTRLRDRAHPQALPERHKAQHEQRHVVYEPAGDGMAWLSAYLSAADAEAIDTRLDDCARALLHEGDDRTVSQIRADAFRDLLLSHRTPDGERVSAIRPTVIVTVPLTTAAGLDDAAGELASGVAIPPGSARALLTAAPWFRRVITDPDTGVPLQLGRTRYRPSGGLRLALRLRDRTCTHPGCTRPATAADIDHTTPWHEGGTTDPGNLAHLCRHHHTLKDAPGWHVAPGPRPGTLTWTTPTGRRYTSRAPHAPPTAAPAARANDPP